MEEEPAPCTELMVDGGLAHVVFGKRWPRPGRTAWQKPTGISKHQAVDRAHTSETKFEHVSIFRLTAGGGEDGRREDEDEGAIDKRHGPGGQEVQHNDEIEAEGKERDGEEVGEEELPDTEAKGRRSKWGGRRRPSEQVLREKRRRKRQTLKWPRERRDAHTGSTPGNNTESRKGPGQQQQQQQTPQQRIVQHPGRGGS